ncbi:hypothetical protein KI387_014623 [Taxus chinensis]|uniref:Uncharacterized protein n=1 Tax=Taxus chinensis TaxID=29808 RepID=A0AA38FI04_TAXCH|nr:hypothetical protein KI387_014623 [Taxus chinensis]
MSSNWKSVIASSIQDDSKIVSRNSNGQRGRFSNPVSLDRAGSHESWISKAGQNSPRLSPKSQREVLPLSQVLPLERLSLEYQKYVRQAELRAVIKDAVGIPSEILSLGTVQAMPLASLGPDELKRVQASVSDNHVRAREQAKYLGEAIAKLDNFRCNRSSRKRLQLETMMSERQNSSMLSDRFTGGAGLLKSGLPSSKNKANSNSVDLVSHRAHQRNKSAALNKQVHMSMLGERLNNVTFPRSSGRPDRERDVLKPGSSGLNQVEEKCCAPLTVKGALEKLKMKRKRSGLKTEVGVHSASNGALNGECEHKLNFQDKLNSDSQGRQNEVHCFRSNIHDKNQAAETRYSPPPVRQCVRKRSNKMTCIARRKNLVALSLNQVDDISFAEASACAAGKSAKPNSHGVLGSGCSSNCSSGPLGKLKNENLNFLTELVANNDLEGDSENKCLEMTKKNGSTGVNFNPAGPRIGKLVLPTQKSKVASKEGGGDGVHQQGRSRRGLEAGITIVCQADDGTGLTSNAKQLNSMGPVSRKVKCKPNRSVTKKSSSDHKPSIRPRCPVNSGSSHLTGETDVDHKELLAAVDDANNASRLACSKPFWKEMEPYFRIVTQDDLDYLKHQVELICDETQGCLSQNYPKQWKSLSSVNAENNELSFYNIPRDMQAIISSPGVDSTWLEKMTPLSQRLLSALIVVDENEQGTRLSDDSGHMNFAYMSEMSPCKNCCEIGSVDKGFNRVEPELPEQLKKDNNERLNSSNASISSNGYINYLSGVNIHSDKHGVGCDILEGSKIGLSKVDSGNLKEGHLIQCQKNQNEFQSGYQANCMASGIATHEIKNQQMSLDDKILLELRSIGLFIETVPDLESEDDCNIEEELNKLKKEFREKVCKTNAQIIQLEKSIFENWRSEERERECLAMNKLVLRASNRYLGPRGKGYRRRCMAKKVEQQADFGFVKRTLHRCKDFDETGRSCFNEPALKEKFFSIASKEITTKPAEDAIEGRDFLANVNGGGTQCPPDMKPSDALVVAAQNSVHLVVQTHEKDKGGNVSSDPCQISATSLEQFGGKLLLEDAIGNSAPRDAPVRTSSLLGGTKGKHSEREQEEKGQNKESITRMNNAEDGPQGLSNVKGKRKAKTKSKQITAHLSKDANGLLDKPTGELSKLSPTLINVAENPSNKIVKKKDEFTMGSVQGVVQNLEYDSFVIDLSHVELPGVDYVENFDVCDNDQNFDSFFEDNALQDADGDSVDLGTPTDDLSVITK